MRIETALLLLPLAACAGQGRPSYSYWQPGTHRTMASAQGMAGGRNPAYVPDLIDGSYQGTAYLTSAPGTTARSWWSRPQVADEVCPHTTMGVVEIDQRLLTYAYAPDLIFTPTVAADGTIAQTIGDAMFSGKVAHNRLTFNVVTPICTTRFFGHYKLNHSY